jgi:N-sulfoglucosamine sulfohydrolase
MRSLPLEVEWVKRKMGFYRQGQPSIIPTAMNARCFSILIKRIVVVLLFMTGIAAGAADIDPRWNILFCFADDWGRYASCYAKVDGRPSINDVIKTPNMDRVAREGVLFKNAFVNAPSCTPCRSSLLSGRYFFNTGRGAILNGAVWDETIPTFPLLIRDAGYHIGKSYKVWSPGTPADAPFGGQKYGYEKAGRAPNNFSEEATARVEKGMSVAAARDEIHSQVRQNFDAFLADRKPGQPWHYFFGPTTTHRTWIKGSGKKLWGIEPDALKGKMPPFLPDVPEVREDIADYLGEAQAYDSYIGVLLKRLEEIGELNRTLVVISGDHGMPGVPSGKCNLYDHGVAVGLLIRVPGGHGGRVLNDFVRLPDLAPTFMEVAGVKPPEGLYGRTLMPLLKSERSGQIDSSRDWVVTGRERHVATAREGNLPYPMRALRTPDFTYIRNFQNDRWPMGSPKGVTATETPAFTALQDVTYTAFADMDSSPTKAWLVTHREDTEWKWLYDFAFGKRPAEELYDVRKDPYQIKNVANDPEYASQKKRLSERLMKLLIDAKDPRVTGDGKTFEQSPFTDAGPDPLEAGKGKGKKKAEVK